MATPSNLSMQYNEIFTAYTALYPTEGISSLPCAALEEAQFYAALQKPAINLGGKRILDLACGSGFYSRKYLEWGAVNVVGVDISSEMVKLAQASASATDIPASKLRFVVGDVTDSSLTIEGQVFDIVTSAWLLNYAPDTATMKKMWDTIARHLVPGGHYVGLTIPPLLCVGMGNEARLHEAGLIDCAGSANGAWGKYGNRVRVLDSVNDGLMVEVELGFKEKGEDFAAFETYYLGLETFQRSIAQCEVDGRKAFEGLEWLELVIPDALREGKPVGYWNEAAIIPPCKVCIAKRRL